MTKFGYAIEIEKEKGVFLITQINNGKARILPSGYEYEIQCKTLESFVEWRKKYRHCIAFLSVLETLERVRLMRPDLLKACCLNI